MLGRTDGLTVYLAPGGTDMRKSIDGLVAIVTYTFELDVFGNSLFVFCNQSRDKLKILHWDCNGFWLYYRRLSRGRFKWPQSSDGASVLTISYRELQWLLDGLPIDQRQAHRPVTERVL